MPVRNGTHERHMMAFEANVDRRFSRPARSSSSVVRLSLLMRSHARCLTRQSQEVGRADGKLCSAVEFSVNLGCNHVKKTYNFCERDKYIIVIIITRLALCKPGLQSRQEFASFASETNYILSHIITRKLAKLVAKPVLNVAERLERFELRSVADGTYVGSFALLRRRIPYTSTGPLV